MRTRVRVRHDHDVAAAQMPLDAITQGDPAIALRNDVEQDETALVLVAMLRASSRTGGDVYAQGERKWDRKKIAPLSRTRSSTCGTIANGSRIAARRSRSGVLIKDPVVSVMVSSLPPPIVEATATVADSAVITTADNDGGKHLMPTYMDVHDGFVGVSQEQFEEAHRRDLEVQGEEGVSYDHAWLDPRLVGPSA